MSLFLSPKEITGKFHYISGSVELKEGVKLTEKEKKVFETFKAQVEEALKKEFDKIVIAIKNEKIVQNVCNELKNKGVPESKIIWDIQTIYD